MTTGGHDEVTVQGAIGRARSTAAPVEAQYINRLIAGPGGVCTPSLGSASAAVGEREQSPQSMRSPAAVDAHSISLPITLGPVAFAAGPHFSDKEIAVDSLRRVHLMPDGLQGLGPKGDVLGVSACRDTRNGQDLFLRVQNGHRVIFLSLSAEEAWWLIGRMARHLPDPPQPEIPEQNAA